MNRIRSTWKPLVSVFFLMIWIQQPAHALPGDLDTSFSSDGKVTTDLSSLGLGRFSRISAIAIQPDGKIVAGGGPVLARYNTNGSLDAAFGNAGIVTFSLTGNDSVIDIAILADGKIMMALEAGNLMGLARFNANGSLDTTFGTAGKVTTDLGQPNGIFIKTRDMAIQDDGKIVVGGALTIAMALVRFNSNGTLDSSFGSGGLATVTTDSPNTTTSANGVAIQADGKIVVHSASSFLVRRFNTNGTLDSNFGDGGTVTTAFPGLGTAQSVAIQADGKIVVSGQSNGGIALARYNSNGVLDSSFSGDGKVTTPSGSGRNVAIQPDGKIVVAGSTTTGGFDISVARFNADGSFSSTFSGDGVQTTDFGEIDSANSMAIQKGDGRIVLGGASDHFGSGPGDPGTAVFALARYHAFECGGKDVTILGTDGPDTIRGKRITSPRGQFDLIFDFQDVILGRGGNDSIDGGGNNDTICGGDGNDVILGGNGNDTLFGDGGSDALQAGDGTDTCVGTIASGDTFTSCETINSGGGGFSGVWEDVSQQCNSSDSNFKCKLSGIVKVENPGTETTAVTSLIAVFLSEDETLDENDTFLEYLEVGPLEGHEARRVKFKSERADGFDASGQFLIAVLDALDLVPELNEANNIVVSRWLQ